VKRIVTTSLAILLLACIGLQAAGPTSDGSAPDPIKALRTWAFIFCFFSIGLTTRFRELARTGTKPFFAFTAGVAVNVTLGFVLSSIVFAHYWTHLSH